ncbi:DUF4190 domain-containing protein [Bacillus aquiflavi]|uniref:DUF4190 domain-containing protein n=1 Tax=Bacillus aquiflavi TaxID=2672567 RepID=A0A6B3VV51_9BACI|nr:DUF4190 domain-containing protein [Bacillus aquiflavi]MBA4535842.1 DUF4190 domain-containing protein [Bacillus aquiflavi]NEY80217.1 DUF4190 domain-containing protein [Bacillus aquiflavi]UAC47267.1 DUF4190 domain-containing protein [Bacillus aquiflavi]
MTDENRNNEGERDLRQYSDDSRYGHADYVEETSAEFAAPVYADRERDNDNDRTNDDYNKKSIDDNDINDNAGRGWGYTALILSILSLFTLPVLFGGAGIVLGFMARRRGAETLGVWAIGIGAVSIIIGIFIMPFF